jgi:hypothetical protein
MNLEVAAEMVKHFAKDAARDELPPYPKLNEAILKVEVAFLELVAKARLRAARRTLDYER